MDFPSHCPVSLTITHAACLEYFPCFGASDANAEFLPSSILLEWILDGPITGCSPDIQTMLNPVIAPDDTKKMQD